MAEVKNKCMLLMFSLSSLLTCC